MTLSSETVRTLSDLLRASLARYPRVDFRLFQSSAAQMRQQLEHDGVDLYLSSLAVEGPGIRSIPLLTEEVLLAVPLGHRLAKRRHVDLKEAATESFVSTKPGYWQRELAPTCVARRDSLQQSYAKSTSRGPVRSLVSAGLGLSFLPTIARRAATEPAVAWLHVDLPMCKRTIRLAWHEEHYLSAAARQLRQFAVEHFAQLAMDHWTHSNRNLSAAPVASGAGTADPLLRMSRRSAPRRATIST